MLTGMLPATASQAVIWQVRIGLPSSLCSAPGQAEQPASCASWTADGCAPFPTPPYGRSQAPSAVSAPKPNKHTVAHSPYSCTACSNSPLTLGRLHHVVAQARAAHGDGLQRLQHAGRGDDGVGGGNGRDNVLNDALRQLVRHALQAGRRRSGQRTSAYQAAALLHNPYARACQS